jgi:hypothetical protein
MPPVTYRRKAEVVNALKYTGSNKQEMKDFAPGMITEETNGTLIFRPTPATLSQSFVVDINDWILKDVAGMYYHNQGETFEMYYQPGAGP